MKCNLIKNINWQNYTNVNYILVLLAQVLITVTILSFLMPVLDFIAINLRKNSTSTFYDYAAIANITLLLPNLLAIVTGSLITNFSFQQLSKFIGIVGIVLSLIGYFFNAHLFLEVVAYILIVSLMLGALGIAIYRLMMSRLSHYLDDIQGDIFIFTGIGSACGYKIAGFLYEQYGIRYIYIIAMITFAIIWLIGAVMARHELKTLPENDFAKTQVAFSQKLTIRGNLVRIYKDKILITSIAFFCVFCFFNAPFDMLVATINYHKNFGTHVYSSFLSIASVAGFIAALLFKLPTIQQLNKKYLFIGFAIVYGIIYISFALINKYYLFYIGMLLVGFSRTILQIAMNLLIGYRVSSDLTLTKIAPLINGIIVSTVTFTALISSWLVNLLLKHGISYASLLIIFGGFILLAGLCLKKINLSEYLV